jgi:hypothetical protein
MQQQIMSTMKVLLLLLSLLATTKFSFAQTTVGKKPEPFIIAPMIEWFGYCNKGFSQKNFETALDLCAKSKDFGIDELNEVLNSFEQGGANGAVQIGYTVGINLLTLQQDGAADTFKKHTQALRDIKRPVVFYLFANHFASSTLKNPISTDSLAKFSDQTVPKEKYFGGGISPLTLDMSSQISVNKLRFSALQMIGNWYKSLPPSSKDRIIAITMAGELHHFYDDFSSGMGRYENIRVTDYSKSTAQEFQNWIKYKYKNIDAVNMAYGSNYKNFESITPPSKDIRKDKTTPLHSHFDSYAHGILPIDGWLEKLPADHSIVVYLNGKAVGKAEYGLNRQDVYEAVADVKTAQLGFRYLLDFSQLSRGAHTIQIMVEGPKGYELAKRTFMVLSGVAASEKGLGKNPTASQPPKELRFYLDRPNNGLTVYYNPLAKDWYSFRSSMVTRAYDSWFDRAVASGLPAEKMFSHQIAVATVGGWNPVLFASDESIRGQHRYKKGINVYGGSASMALLRRHYLVEDEPFGVPEFHSQAWKDPTAPMRILKEFKAGGAVFVTPYFVSMAPDKFRAKYNAHDKFRIAPDNPDYGSNQLYKAIVELAKE